MPDDVGQSELNLARVNLNLLVALEALLQEGHVGRAARRVGVTQSAMSQSLRQLRALYGDPLLAKGQAGMQPTPRGQQILGELRSGLSLLRGTFAPPTFEPGTADRTFTLGVSDAVGLAITPDLVRVAGRVAPGVTFQVQPLERRPHVRAERLESGEVDLAFGADLDDAPGLRRMRLEDGEFVGLVRADNPFVSDRPTRSDYASYTHVVFAASSACQQLIGDGLIRKVALRTPYLLLAALVVAESDHVVLVRRNMARALLPRFPLRTFHPPIPGVDMPYHMVWHERFDQEPGHQWLRSQVQQLLSQEGPLDADLPGPA